MSAYSHPLSLSPDSPPPHPPHSLFSPSEESSLNGFLADFVADPLTTATHSNPHPHYTNFSFQPARSPLLSLPSHSLQQPPLGAHPAPALPLWTSLPKPSKDARLQLHYPSQPPLQIIPDSRPRFPPPPAPPLAHCAQYVPLAEPRMPLDALRAYQPRPSARPPAVRRSLSGSSGSSQTTRPAQVSSSSSTTSSTSANHTPFDGPGRVRVHTQQAPVAVVKKEKPGLLSQEQKRANHIASEQKRRAAIREGYGRLCTVVPSLRAPADGTDEESGGEGEHSRGAWRAGKAGREGAGTGIATGAKRKRKKTDSLEPRSGAKSEAVVLAKTVEYLRQLHAERTELVERLRRAEALASAHGLDVGWTGRRRVWEEKWTGTTGDGEVLETDETDECREEGWAVGMDE